MNTPKLRFSSALIAVAAFVAVNAFADSNNNYPVQPKTKSTTTRAAVKAEAAKAQKEDGVMKNDDTYPVAKASKTPGKTRAEVKTELKNAEVKGKLPPVTDSGFPAAAK
jgi:hypothetical protein